MPLFGGHKHNDKKHNTLHKDDQLQGAGTGMTNSSMGGVATADSALPPAHAGGGRAAQQDMYNQSERYNNQPMAKDYGAGTGMTNDQTMPGGGMGMSDDGYKMTPGNIPPSSHLNTQAAGGTGHSTTGKVEKAIGSVVGSNALKAKGMQKEMEANALKTQSAELAEAERLEREALLRRERAIAHGAHPENRHLGGPGSGQV
ncbi:hypothetical protein GYMLUDRAFT_36219 [Collybiopsis luxurians FD-317 M1]|nr:hypothetical protein GYMLUDRAFT_36219 [Collybiopsis luxurians FD-317 M1]